MTLPANKINILAKLPLAALCCVCFVAGAQDPQFSQHYNQPLITNPAFAGTAQCMRFGAAYRHQWASLPGRYVTYAAYGDKNFPEYRLGLGMIMMHDVAGTGALSNSEAGLVASYYVPLNKKMLWRFGAQSSLVTRSINYARLRFGDQLSDAGPTGNSSIDPIQSAASINYPDFNAGSLMHTARWWLGIAVSHLSRPNQSFVLNNENSRLPMRWNVHGGYKIELNLHGGPKPRNAKATYLSPVFLYKRQGDFEQAEAGVFFEFEPIQFAFLYRGLPFKNLQKGFINQDAIIIQYGMRYNDFSFGYSYDYTVSDLQTIGTGGSHEISLSYLFCKNKPPKNKTKPIHNVDLPCPMFYKNSLNDIEHNMR